MYHLNVKIKTFSKVLNASKTLFVESQFGFSYAALGAAAHITFLVLLLCGVFILFLEGWCWRGAEPLGSRQSCQTFLSKSSAREVWALLRHAQSRWEMNHQPQGTSLLLHFGLFPKIILFFFFSNVK